MNDPEVRATKLAYTSPLSLDSIYLSSLSAVYPSLRTHAAPCPGPSVCMVVCLTKYNIIVSHIIKLL